MYKTVQPNQQSLPVAVTILQDRIDKRKQLEQFIHNVYSQQYDADVQHFMPLLMGFYGRTGDYLAALGLRFATSGPLFLEHYLDQPIEKKLAAVTHAGQHEISRASIVEVGNLAAHHAGGTRWLIIALTAYLQGAGYDWVVFTSVPSLRNSFRKLGLRLHTLGPASESVLPAEEHGKWGRYYHTGPLVMVVNVHHTYGVLERLLRFEQTLTALQHIWQQSFAFGNVALFQNRNEDWKFAGNEN